MTATLLYENTEDNSARFVLGTRGDNPLVCFGVNPSTATPERLDLTVTRVEEYARRNRHDSWVMLNLYPQRATDPKLIHDAYVPELKAENERHIAELIGGRTINLLAAWGEPIQKRTYLLELLAAIVRITDGSLCQWSSIGELTKSKHPRHPSRGAYLPLRSFDMAAYLRDKNARAARAGRTRDGVLGSRLQPKVDVCVDPDRLDDAM